MLIYDIDIHRGSSVGEVLNVLATSGTPQDLSSYTSGYAPIREKYGVTGLFGMFDVNIAQSGVVNLSMRQESSSFLPESQGRYELILLDASGNRESFAGGLVNIYPSLD